MFECTCSNVCVNAGPGDSEESIGSDGTTVGICCVAPCGCWEPSMETSGRAARALLKRLSSASRKPLFLDICHTPSISQVSLIVWVPLA